MINPIPDPLPELLVLPISFYAVCSPRVGLQLPLSYPEYRPPYSYAASHATLSLSRLTTSCHETTLNDFTDLTVVGMVGVAAWLSGLVSD